MKRGGGVSLLICNNIPFMFRNDLAYFDSEMESVFIEIYKSIFLSNANIIIGLFYKMLDSSVDMFNERLADISNSVQKENKLFYSQVILTQPSLNMKCIDQLQNPWVPFTPIMCILLRPRQPELQLLLQILLTICFPTILIYHVDIPKAYHALVCLIILPHFTLLVIWAQQIWRRQCN